MDKHFFQKESINNQYLKNLTINSAISSNNDINPISDCRTHEKIYHKSEDFNIEKNDQKKTLNFLPDIIDMEDLFLTKNKRLLDMKGIFNKKLKNLLENKNEEKFLKNSERNSSSYFNLTNKFNFIPNKNEEYNTNGEQQQTHN